MLTIANLNHFTLCTDCMTFGTAGTNLRTNQRQSKQKLR